MKTSFEDVWVNLLNDISQPSESFDPENEIFLTEDGEPTDRFLEAVKADLEFQSEPSDGFFHYEQHLRPQEKKKSKRKDLEGDITKKFDRNRSSVKSKSRTNEDRQFFDKNLVGKKEEKSSSNKSVHNDSVPTFESDLQFIESDSKVKSYQLRLKGQLQCIKSLERQLHQSQELLSLRDKQLSQLQSKYKNLSEIYHKNQDLTPSSESWREDSRFQQLIQQYKKQCDILQAKLQEEVAKKRRGEERFRTIKDYAERIKLRCSELEIENAELNGAVAEAQAKLQKYRQSYRDSASDISSQEKKIVSQQNELQKLVNKIDLVSCSLKERESELDQKCEEIRQLRKDLAIHQSENKQLKLHIGILQEKQLCRRVEERFRGQDSRKETSSEVMDENETSPARKFRKRQFPSTDWKGIPTERNTVPIRAFPSHSSVISEVDRVSPEPLAESIEPFVDHISRVEEFETQLDQEIVETNLSRCGGHAFRRGSGNEKPENPNSAVTTRTSDLVREVASRANDSSVTSPLRLRSLFQQASPVPKLSRLQEIYSRVTQKTNPS